MAKQEVGLKIDVDVSSVGNMKQQLRAATNELVAMNEKFGSTSKEAIAAAQKVAGLKDAIGDAKALADTFNPDKKFVALGGAVQGAVSGFSALQGAMGLFGSESKDVEKLLLKVQSAMALQQGISGVAGAIDSFKLLAGNIATSSFALKANAVATNLASGAMKLFGVSVATTSNAFKVLKGAIIATGIGALIVIVGELINYMSDLADSTDDAAEAQKKLEKAQKDAADAIELQNKMLSEQIDLSKRNTDIAVKRAQATGKSEQEITKITRDGILERKKILEADLQNRGTNDAQYFEKLKELRKVNNELEDFDLDQQIKRRQKSDVDRQKRTTKNNELIKKENDEKIAADKVLKEIELKELTERQRQEAILLDEFNKNKATLMAAGITNFLSLESQYRRDLASIDSKFKQEEKERIKKEQEEKLLKDKEKQQADIDNKLAQFARIRKETKESNDEQILSDQAVIASKEQLLSVSANVLGQISNLVGQGTAAGKAAALAEIIINTGVGFANGLRIAQQGAAAKGPAAPYAFPIFYATQVAAVLQAAGRARAILSQVPKGGGGGGAIAGGGGINTTAPIAPQLAPQVTATAVNTAAVNQLGNQATRAYVLNSDIQNNEQRNAYINRNASLG